MPSFTEIILRSNITPILLGLNTDFLENVRHEQMIPMKKTVSLSFHLHFRSINLYSVFEWKTCLKERKYANNDDNKSASLLSRWWLTDVIGCRSSDSGAAEQPDQLIQLQAPEHRRLCYHQGISHHILGA